MSAILQQDEYVFDKVIKNNKIIKICPSCNSQFEISRHEKKKYCSQKCNSERNERYMIVQCDYCGKDIRIKKTIYQEKLDGKRKHIYCSKECANNGKKTGYDIICDNCGRVFYRRKYHIDRQSSKQQNKFCSVECEFEFKHKQAETIRECEQCGTNFTVLQSDPKRFCSIDCQHIWQTTRVGELNPRFTSVSMPCSYCGKDHYVKPYKLDEQQYFFCSVGCRQSWYAEIYSQTKEFSELHRNKILKQISDGVFQSIDSQPQLIVNKLLDKLFILYEREHPYVYYAVDNYLVDYNLIIEVQGDYWHANPCVFDSKLNETQYDRINKDKRKHTYIKNQYGIEILYLWENDLINRSDVCEFLIKHYIDNAGILNNYHSFNYDIQNGHLILKNNIIIPYQERETEQYKKLLVS